MEAEAAIGVDIGGTSLKFAAVDREGRVLRHWTRPTPAIDPSEGIMRELLAGIDKLLAELKEEAPELRVAGIGIGSAGQIHKRDGSVAFAVDTIPGYTGTPIKARVEERFPELPTFVDNDVNVLALAEKHYGAGRELQDFVCVALGTGIGGAIVQGGRLVHGVYGGAGELGHLSVDFNGPRCSCGNYGCIELYASGTGIERLLKERFENAAKPAWALNAAGLLNAWQSGDALAGEAMDVVLAALGSALAGVVHALNPEAIVLGGGIVEKAPALLAAIEDATRSRTSPVMWKHVRLLPAIAGSRAGVIGAAAQVWQYT
ncbi:ROK family protein [Paenibacillus antri]|uniref:ROK family protein n=1 Tax=Paenibacillus antri TaxID=2582848 RepID=A0A5R9G915_9BACL|nr:ROK family protein [Paenibacillus antri]TLS51569.1 ROK family protein [Paenibacillus antri]